MMNELHFHDRMTFYGLWCRHSPITMVKGCPYPQSTLSEFHSMKPVLVLANCLLAIVFTANFKTVIAQAIDETAKTESSDADIDNSVDQILQGHSQHGEAFNEGPRQAAYLMGGTGNVNFPATTDSEQAQAFINQGVGQLHGF